MIREVITPKNINSCDITGTTPLNYWILSRQPVENVKYIIDEGADVNICDSALDTPLHAAVLCKNPCYVRLLLESGRVTTVDAINMEGHTPLQHHLAYTPLPNAEIVKLLLDAGAPTAGVFCALPEICALIRDAKVTNQLANIKL
jgi:ankyrin repeat protein